MRVLTVNAGSSSLKAGLYAVTPGGSDERREQNWERGGLGGPDEFRRAVGEALAGLGARVEAIGHRVVAPGALWPPRRLDADLAAELSGLIAAAPDHLPQMLAAMEQCGAAFPGVPQVVCSDSAFHASLPAVAHTLALPAEWRERGIRRCGYHGLSCESIVWTLAQREPAAAGGRLIIAHLGSGASLTAVRDGVSVDTTMGWTPLGGIPMSSRSGDLDPGVLVYLAGAGGVPAAELDRRLNHDAGLRGISGLSGDMKELLAAAAAGHTGAALAVEIFVYQVRRQIGGLAAALGGLDRLVFTGGIGEHAPEIRAGVLSGLGFLGNFEVEVVTTDEDRMMARHTARVLA